METLEVVGRVVVGLVLLWAGIAKLRSRRWPVLALEMGTPRLVVVTLPAVEAMLGLGLVLQVGPSVLPWIATGLFAAFTVVVGVQYFSGSAAPCNCFGGDGEERVNRTTLARNLALVVLAALAAG